MEPTTSSTTAPAPTLPLADGMPKQASDPVSKPTPAPTVVNFTPPTSSPSNGSSSGGFFHTKAFIGGIISIVLLMLVLIGVVVYIKKPTATNPKATDCIQVDSTNQNQHGSTATVQVTVKNNCTTPITIQFHKEQNWCPGVSFHDSSKTYIVCQKNGSSEITDLVTLQPGQSSQSVQVSQQVGNNGTCGSAQVDVFYRVKDGADVGPYFGTAWLSPCQHLACNAQSACIKQDCKEGEDCSDGCTTAADCSFSTPLDCKNVALTGGAATITTAGETRTLTASSTGGDGAVTYSWTNTSTGTNGTLSSTAGTAVTWTAPTTLPTAATTWTITATAKDSKGVTDSTGCVQTLTFTPAVTHLTCQNMTCAPAAGAGTNECTTSSECVHNECVNNACTPVAGHGDNKCNVSGDCIPATHKECRNSSCTTVSGAGSNSCNGDGDCQTATHKECRNSACVSVSGSGSDACNMNSDCQPTQQTHKACQNNACVTVSGAGSNQCTSDVSCQPAATPPPIPSSGSTGLTIAGIILGAGSLLLGALLIL